MSKIIEIRNVSKQFGSKVIYRNVSLDIEEGSCVGFVGANGTGKSVLFQMIAGLTPADSGQITVAGKEISGGNFPDDMGILINEPGYIPNYSGLKNLKLLAEIKNLVGEKEIREAMLLLGLEPDDKTPVRKYSMGMKQKLGFSQAIMEGQRTLILDEPYNALDFKTNQDITKVLTKMKAEGRTILLTSHQHEYLTKLCDTIYCVHENNIVPFTPELQKLYFSI